MKTIYKYPLEQTGYQKVIMPTGSQLLSVQIQQRPEGQFVCLWALVETDNEPESRNFLITDTGREIK